MDPLAAPESQPDLGVCPKELMEALSQGEEVSLHPDWLDPRLPVPGSEASLL